MDRGGIREVITDRRWPEVIRLMTLPKTCTNAGYSLKVIYQRYLLDWERTSHWGLPDISRAPAPRGGMPIPDYKCEDVALLDPYKGRGRPKAAPESASDRRPRRPKRSRSQVYVSDDDDEDEDAPATPIKGGYNAGGGFGAAGGSNATGEREEEEEGGAGDVVDMQRDLNETAGRVARSLGATNDNDEVDWALSVLLVQTNMKLPVFARDLSRRLIEELALRLKECSNRGERQAQEEWKELLVGHLFAGAGFQRRTRIVTILANAVQAEENARAMAASPTLLGAIVDDLRSRGGPRMEQDLESRLKEFVVLESILNKGARVTTAEQASGLMHVLGGELLSRDLRRPASLSCMARLARDNDHLLLVGPGWAIPVLSDIVSLLGEALLVQSSTPGSEDGLLELESCLEVIYQCSGEESLVDRIAAQPMVVHHLMMLLLSSLDALAPRIYLSFYRKAVTVLISLASADASVRQELLSAHLRDLLLVLATKSSVSAELPPLLELLADHDDDDDEEDE